MRGPDFQRKDAKGQRRKVLGRELMEPHELETRAKKQKSESMNLALGLPAGLGKGPDELFAIRFVPEDGLTPVPAIHHMINRSCLLQLQLARHP